MNSDSRDYDEVMLFDFGAIENMDDWLVVNDSVMGGLISDKQSGEFQLGIKWIKAYG